MLLILFLFLEVILAFPIYDVNIKLNNYSDKTLKYNYCNSTNLLTSKVDLYLDNNTSQNFNFKVLNIASGDCTYYVDENCSINFQYFVKPATSQFYYGITPCSNYNTYINVLDMYTSIFTLS